MQSTKVPLFNTPRGREQGDFPAGFATARRAQLGDPANPYRDPSMATKVKKSWQEKLADSKDLPKVETITGRMRQKWGAGTVVIPTPLEVDAAMRKVRKGRLITINELREYFAAQHGATIGCPMTTGIFAWIAAHAADEAEQQGRRRITPYWRTLKSGGELNAKYPGGIDKLRTRLEAEGHRVIQKGRRYFVADYAQSLARLG
ncbi:MAG: methylated DNA-protein cysteine methyltransferase [Pirellulales bacterium]